MRNFVRSHPAYKHDSVVSAEINYDLIVAIDEMWVGSLHATQSLLTIWYSERGVRKAEDLLPADYTGSKEDSGSIGL